MIHKVRGILKAAWYGLCKGNAIHFKGIAHFESRARINLKRGSVRIGRGLVMKPDAYCAVVDGGQLTIGDHVSIARNSMIVCHDSITIGDHCAIGPNVAIYDHDHKFGPDGIKPGYNTTPVVIGSNVWIGTGVIILRGTHIGEGCVIGAGCRVTGDIPPHSLVTPTKALSITPITARS